MAEWTLGEDRTGRQAQRSSLQAAKPDRLGLSPALPLSGDRHNLNTLSAKFRHHRRAVTSHRQMRRSDVMIIGAVICGWKS